MATITHKGNQIHTSGELPKPGAKAPNFRLTRADLSDATLADFAGKVKVLNITPSLDTSVCALSAKRFDAEAGKLKGLVVLNVSRDLPFAAGRFCKSEGLSNIVTLSEMRDRAFGRDYGVEIADGLLAGLLSRAVVVLDAQDRVVHAEQVPEIGQEPDYGKALEAAKKALAAGAGY
ncbi:MAG TPA: thiol peroxidase [Spirochaetia bacterium]|nr:thiol peroxidase [Spirochaetia bacterium]